MVTPNLLQHFKRNGIGGYMVPVDFERTFNSLDQDLLTVAFEMSELVDELKN